MIDFENLTADYELLWPHQIFAAEAAAVAALAHVISDEGCLLLEEAFAGREPRDDFAGIFGMGFTLSPNPRDAAQKLFLRDIVLNAEKLAAHSRKSTYWLHKNAPAVIPENQPRAFKNGWFILAEEFFAKGYFSKVAGYECPDGDSADDVESALSRAMTRRLQIPNLWPPRGILANYNDEDVLYSAVEVLHDLIARPRVHSACHGHEGCAGHFRDPSVAAGRALYRWRVNELLEQSGSPYRLADEGEDKGRMVAHFDDPRAELLAAAPDSQDPATSSGVGHAIALFRKRGATREDKRSACVALARELEVRRSLVERKLLKGDAQQLFHLANKFDLRHRDGKQYEEYGDEFLDWIFWNYLATVELTNRLIAHQT